MHRQYIALSGMAMVLIVLNHAIHMGLETLAQVGYPPLAGGGRLLLTTLQALGVFAVPVFLFISGSFVAYAARRAARLSPTFVWKSVRHILWPYLFWSAAFYFLIFLYHGVQGSPLDYLKNLAVGYPFHFVPLLIAFYVISPLLIPLARRSGWLLLTAIGLYQLTLMNLRDPGMFGFAFPVRAGLLFPPILGNPIADWGIYFPMGLVFGLHAARWKGWMQRYRWLFGGSAVALFVAGLLDVVGVGALSWARYLCPFPLLFVLPVIDRHLIPWMRRLEEIGKRSYGLYLTHLIVMDTLLLAIPPAAGSFFALPILLIPLLFVAGLMIPLQLMSHMEQRRPTRAVYRYVFG